MLVLKIHHSLYNLIKVFKIIASEVNFVLKVQFGNNNRDGFLKINFIGFWSSLYLLSGSLLMVVFINRNEARVIFLVQVKDLSKHFTLSLLQLNGGEMSNGVSKSLEAYPSSLFKYYVSDIVDLIDVSFEIID